MDSPVLQAILLVVVASGMNAAYVLPMKLNKKWQWEHSWFAFSILGVAVVPTIIAMLTVPRLWSTYASVSGGTLAAMALFGAGWGVSLVFFGLALARMGLALTFAICLGTSAAVGALTPLVSQHSDQIMTRQGGLILFGVLAVVVGVALCGLAGRQRETTANAESTERTQRIPDRIPVCLCFGNSWVHAESGIGIRWQHSTRGAGPGCQHSYDVERSMAALPVRGLLARSHLLLLPHAQEWQPCPA